MSHTLPDDACAVDTGVIHEQARDAYEAAGHEYLARVLRGEGLELAPVPGGSHFKAVCPFHADRYPWLVVPIARTFWVCFGCNRAGNVVKFIERTRNLSYEDAKQWLDEHYPIESMS